MLLLSFLIIVTTVLSARGRGNPGAEGATGAVAPPTKQQTVRLLLTSIREYAFYVFFQISKNMTFYKVKSK